MDETVYAALASTIMAALTALMYGRPAEATSILAEVPTTQRDVLAGVLLGMLGGMVTNLAGATRLTTAEVLEEVALIYAEG